MSVFLLPAYHAVSAVAAVLVPLLGGVAPAAAIVVCTAIVRLVLHPLNRAQVRAQQRAEEARRALAPAVAKLRRRYGSDPVRLARETGELYRRNGISAVAGVVPMLVQLPVVFVMYRLFVSRQIGGHDNALLGDTLFGVPLGSHLRDASTAGAAGHLAVFGVLLLGVIAAAAWAVRRARVQVAEQGDMGMPKPPRFLVFLPYLTVLTAAVVPLATGLYLLTTTVWTLVERRVLTRPGRAAGAPRAAAG